MDILIPEVGIVGLETLDSILEGILDNENSNSSSSDLQEKLNSLQELSPASSSMIPNSPENSENETQNLRCITIKSELPDSCSVDNIMVRILFKHIYNWTIKNSQKPPFWRFLALFGYF